MVRHALLLALSLQLCCGGRILFTFTPFSMSHKKSLVPVAVRLAQSGHNVTFWQPWYESLPLPSPHYSEYETIVEQDTSQAMFGDDSTEHFEFIMAQKLPAVWEDYVDVYDLEGKSCSEVFRQHPTKIQELKDEKWDLMVVDPLFNVCGTYLAQLLDVPYVSFSTEGLLPHTMAARNTPVSYAATPLLLHSDYSLSQFYWRVTSMLIGAVQEGQILYGSHIARNYLKSVTSEPREFSQVDFEQRAKMLTATSPQLLNFPIVHAHDIHYLGTKCPPTPKLNLDPALEAFVNDPTSSGTVLIGFGHWTKWKHAPKHMLQTFLETFKRLPEYRFVFHYNGYPIDKLPSNVYTSEWFPQQQLLYHPRTKAFVSHCGMKSMNEAICSKVPVVSYAMFFDQPRNALAMTKHLKVGHNVLKNDVRSDELITAIVDAVNNPQYRQNLDKIVDQLADPILDPLDEVAHKLEHLMRHERYYDRFYRSKAIEMSLIKYYSLDSIALLTLLVVGPLYFRFFLIRFVFRVTMRNGLKLLQLCSAMVSQRLMSNSDVKPVHRRYRKYSSLFYVTDTDV